MNCIIIYASAIILKIKPKLVRVIIASIIGSIYAVLLYVTELEIYTSVISKFILSIIIVYVAYNPQNITKMWKQLLIFYLTSFVFGGVSLYLIYFINPQNISMVNGMFAGDNVLKIVLLGAILAFIIIKISLKVIKTKITSKDMYCNIVIRLNDKQVETKAMIDTGNQVKEPITNTPVIIVESTLLYELLPKEILNNIEEILNGNLDKVSEEVQENYISKLRYIPFKSLGKENGMLLGIKADEVEIENEDESESRKVKNIIIGIYDKSLTRRGEYRALLPFQL